MLRALSGSAFYSQKLQVPVTACEALHDLPSSVPWLYFLITSPLWHLSSPTFQPSRLALVTPSSQSPLPPDLHLHGSLPFQVFAQRSPSQCSLPRRF